MNRTGLSHWAYAAAARAREEAHGAERPTGVSDTQWACFLEWREGKSLREAGRALDVSGESARAYVRIVRLALGLAEPAGRHGRKAQREESLSNQAHAEKGKGLDVTGACRCGLRLFGGEVSCGDCVTLVRAMYQGGRSQALRAMEAELTGETEVSKALAARHGLGAHLRSRGLGRGSPG